MIATMLQESSAWAWIVLGLVLMVLEMLAPGVFLIWFGFAALLTGAADWAFDLSWQAGGIVFAVLSVVSVLVGRRLAKSDDRGEDPNLVLNARDRVLIGHVFTLDAPIVAGEGRIRVGDSFWRITGPDLPAGAVIRVARVDGATLVVERG